MLSVSSVVIPLLVGAAGALAQQTSRTITFKNSCAKDVWIIGTSGSVGTCDAGCPDGSTCNSNNNICFFDVPTPSSGNWRVTAGGTNSITFPAWNNNNGAAWSGNFNFCADGTVCVANGQVAEPGTCDSQGCASFHVGTEAEMTLSKQGLDYYDISNIGGVSVPISFSPATDNPSSSDPYFCAHLGAIQSTTGLGASPWQFSPPSPMYVWVVPDANAASCNSDSDCGGSTCGLALDQTDQVTFSQVCGTVAGYWTQNAICAANVNTPVTNCTAPISNGPYQTTQSAFQGCTGGNDDSGSCYQPGANSNCCGCANWNQVLGNTAVPDSTQQCVSINPLWTQDIQPTLQWLKAGAPNSYTFPFDDMSSTSTCNLMNGGFNTQNYVIETCPGGVYWGTPAAAPPPASTPPPPPPSSSASPPPPPPPPPPPSSTPAPPPPPPSSTPAPPPPPPSSTSAPPPPPSSAPPPPPSSSTAAPASPPSGTSCPTKRSRRRRWQPFY